MSSESIKSKERSKNSGGIFPCARQNSNKLLIGIEKLKKLFPPLQSKAVTPFCRMLFNFIYLWLTGFLASDKKITKIPDITIVSGSHPCQLHCLRSIRESAPSWVEYAIEIKTKHGTSLQWQPIPNGLNHWFSQAITNTKHAEKCWILKEKEKKAFLSFINSKWRTTSTFKGKHAVRKDMLFKYFIKMAQSDSNLSARAKVALQKNHKIHHSSALAYQTLDTEQIRYAIFIAQTYYLDRLRQAIIEPKLITLSNVPIPASDASLPIIYKTQEQQRYLNTPGRIPSFHYDVSAALRQYIVSKPLIIGSTRQLNVDSTRRFFQALESHAKTLDRNEYTLESLRELLNFRAYELSLLFIVLTSSRPTHEIAFQKDYCFNNEHALIFDKGRYRSILLCDHFRQALLRYEFLKNNLSRHSSITFESPLMWFLIDESMEVKPLSAKLLRHFMTKWWTVVMPGEVAAPYQLRHFFAQHALTSSSPTLTTQDIDSLMGHANWGEQFGSSRRFPLKENKLKAFLNNIPDFLHLSAISEEDEK